MTKKPKRETACGRGWHDWQNDNANEVAQANPRDAGQMGYTAGWIGAYESLLDKRLEMQRIEERRTVAMAILARHTADDAGHPLQQIINEVFDVLHAEPVGATA